MLKSEMKKGKLYASKNKIGYYDTWATSAGGIRVVLIDKDNHCVDMDYVQNIKTYHDYMVDRVVEHLISLDFPINVSCKSNDVAKALVDMDSIEYNFNAEDVDVESIIDDVINEYEKLSKEWED